MANVSICGDKLKNNIVFQMFSETCVPVEDCTVDEMNECIGECQAMLDHAIQLNDKEEIAYWRGALQNAKITKRSIVNT